MNWRQLSEVSATVLLLAFSVAAACAEPAGLATVGERDPFTPLARRSAERPAGPLSPGVPAGTNPSRATDGPAAVPAWHPTLRALLIDGPNSLANVGGVLIGIGKSIDGYKLIEVREREARFTRKGRVVVLRLPQEQETDPR